MKHQKRILPVLLLLGIVLGAVAFIDLDKVTVGPMDEDIYTPAAQTLSQSSVVMDVTADRAVILGDSSYTQKHTIQINYQGLDTDNANCHVTGVVQYGSYSTGVTQIYSGGQMYLTLNDSRFRGNVSQEDFLAQFPPVQLLTPENYLTITQTTAKQGTRLQFTQPTAAEDWAIPQDAQLVTASGYVELSPEGVLQTANYEITYTINSVQFQYKITAQYTTGSNVEIPIPDIAEYTALEDVYAPIYLEQVYGYLEQAKHLDATLSESIFSEVDPIYYDSTITLTRSGRDATVHTQVELTDNSRGGQVSSYSQTETFLDGSYSITTNTERSEEGSRINSQDMDLYCKELLTGNILSPAYVTGVTKTAADGLLTYRFSAGEALAEIVCQKSCETIYQNPAFLDSVSESYDDYEVTYYLTVDPLTGLPVSSGLDFTGVHSVEGIRYLLTTRYQQAYNFQPN